MRACAKLFPSGKHDRRIVNKDSQQTFLSEQLTIYIFVNNTLTRPI